MSKDEYNDYFDGEEEEEKPAEIEETPEQIEAKKLQKQIIDKPDNGLRRGMAWVVAFLVLFVAVWGVFVFFVPYVSEAQQRGVIVQVRQEGFIFKTFEGIMITDEWLADTMYMRSREFVFSVEDDSVARDIMRLQSTGRHVTLSYKEYRRSLPWRGNSKVIVTGYAK